MEIAILVIGGILALIGLVGAFLPVLPGPPIAFLSMVALALSKVLDKGTSFWIVFGALLILTIVVQVLDVIVPAWGTKKLGGSKFGIAGAILGLIIGIFFSPFSALLSIILGPMIGAIAGELIYTYTQKKQIDKESFRHATKAGLGAFMGFMTGTVMKFTTSLIIVGFFVFYAIQLFKAVV